MTRVFEFVAVSGLDIVVSRAKICGKRAEASFAAPAVSKYQKKHPGSSWDKDFAGLKNRQKRLTE